jgi:FtsH-binding integral membrane protein
LKNVYTTLAISLLFAGNYRVSLSEILTLKQAIGSIASSVLQIGGNLFGLLGLGLVVVFSFTPAKEVGKRLGLLMSFSFVEGLALGPFLQAVAELDPR